MAFDERVMPTSKQPITTWSLTAEGFRIQMLNMDDKLEKPSNLI